MEFHKASDTKPFIPSILDDIWPNPNTPISVTVPTFPTITFTDMSIPSKIKLLPIDLPLLIFFQPNVPISVSFAPIAFGKPQVEEKYEPVEECRFFKHRG